jgi:hypothetical protein
MIFIVPRVMVLDSHLPQNPWIANQLLEFCSQIGPVQTRNMEILLIRIKHRATVRNGTQRGI